MERPEGKTAKRVVLCSDGQCCPVVTVGADEVSIVDDFGGAVRMTRAQFDVFVAKAKNGEF